MPRNLFPLAVALGCSLSALAQTAQPACSGVGGIGSQSNSVSRTGVGVAYTLTATIKTETKLADGNTISGSTTSRQVRDSEGRTQVDTPAYCAVDKDGQARWEGTVMVRDPVAKTQSYWHEDARTVRESVTVTHMPSMAMSKPPSPQEEYRMAVQFSHAFDNASPQMKHQTQQVEDLGQRMIAGIQASGMRITRTTPAEMQGNALPIVSVEERWESDDYGMILLDINDDPVLGKSTYEVTTFTAGEPDAALFQPPAEYAVEERSLRQ